MDQACILHVEDSEDDVLLLGLAFKQAGITHPLRVVSSARQALDYLAGARPFGDRKTYPLPALVVLDLKLPDQSGIEVLEWIREQPAFKTLPVMVFSSWANPADIEHASHAGSNSFQLKPLDIRQYQAFARRLKKEWLSRPPH